jgi:hypothetical protein
MSYPLSSAALTGLVGPAVRLAYAKRIPNVVKRTERPGARPAQAEADNKPAWPAEQHSGEGSASALESLQKMEIRRVASQAAPEPAPSADEPDPG